MILMIEFQMIHYYGFWHHGVHYMVIMAFLSVCVFFIGGVGGW